MRGERHRRRRTWEVLGIAVALAVTLSVVVHDLGPTGSGAAPSASSGRSRTGGGVRGPAAAHAANPTTPSTPAPPTTTTTTTTVPPTTTTTGPGTLPQTSTLPPASGPQFQSEMADLWAGVVRNDVTAAMPAFFPENAYVQLKSITGPRTDFENRLVADFRSDLAAAHALLGADPASAVLQSVSVPEQYAHWVPPGVCYNSIGYYEVPNARVVYTAGGAVRSFGIASMISWRGQWYVVHLGLVTRPTTTQQGIVDDPATGPGTSAYSPTC